MIIARVTKNITDEKTNVSRGHVGRKLKYFHGEIRPCTAMTREKLLGNYMFYANTVGVQSDKNNTSIRNQEPK